jgi:hypothetical protein
VTILWRFWNLELRRQRPTRYSYSEFRPDISYGDSLDKSILMKSKIGNWGPTSERLARGLAGLWSNSNHQKERIKRIWYDNGRKWKIAGRKPRSVPLGEVHDKILALCSRGT